MGSYLCGKIAGSDWQAIFRDARRWFEANYETLPKDGIATKVFLFGFSRGADLSQRLDIPSVVLHDSHSLASNLWGAFDRVKRDLPRLRLHFACKGL